MIGGIPALGEKSIGFPGTGRHHALGDEHRPDLRDCVLHHADPGRRVPEARRQDSALEDPVESLHMLFRHSILSGPPSRDAILAAFEPPSVERAEVQNSIESNLHAAGARSLDRRQGRVLPDVAARDDDHGHVYVVIGQEGDRDATMVRLSSIS